MPKAKKNPDVILQAIANEAILSAVLNLPREYLLSHPEIKIKPVTARKIAAMQQRVLNGEPLAYVIGEKWFYGARFAVNKQVLIPRPETELLIECALELIKDHSPSMIFDIGTGSGAIAVTLARCSGKPVFAVDISANALNMAKKNSVAILEQKASLVRFAKSDLLEKISVIPDGALICANLPYLSASELRELSIAHEPRLALHGAYRTNTTSAAMICNLLEQIAAKRKGSVEIILEMNYNQAATITKKAQRLFPNAEIAVRKDYSKFDRLVIISAQ